MKYKSFIDPQLARDAESVVIEFTEPGVLRMELYVDGHDICYDFYLTEDLERKVNITMDQVPMGNKLPVAEGTEEFFATAREAQFELSRLTRQDLKEERRQLMESLFVEGVYGM